MAIPPEWRRVRRSPPERVPWRPRLSVSRSRLEVARRAGHPPLGRDAGSLGRIAVQRSPSADLMRPRGAEFRRTGINKCVGYYLIGRRTR
ncbi:hypothetical protein MOX02_33940 [Methylobacterium oxalidis]|uniref:Uncharacterized protein n=1 Tax=Methylobacterium oxalidis TaxID=944322 RepID=A0A512J5U6_9HYPH|nr:hypothetical protein MOX02_33940 [Methylobacterium oxalidis]